MLSEAGRKYETTKVVNPLNTMQRFKYYELEPVKSNRKMPKPYQTLQTNLRDKHDSYFLRYAREIVTSTNHSPNHSTIVTTERRQVIPKAKFQRYIGDVRGQDYSLPLPKNCNHRCARANSVVLEKLATTTSSKNTNISFQNENSPEAADLVKGKKKTEHSEGLAYKSLDLKKSLSKSTEPSLIKKRSQATIQLELSQDVQPRKFKGVSFKSSEGHQYLKEVEDRSIKQKIPETYDLTNVNQGLIKNSFREPRIHVKFGTFRDSIKTKIDRSDPEWHTSIDTSSQQILEKDLSYDFNKYSARKIYEVKNKYAYRASMNLYMFPAKSSRIPQL